MENDDNIKKNKINYRWFFQTIRIIMQRLILAYCLNQERKRKMKIRFRGLSRKIIVLLIILSLGFNTTLIVIAQPAELGAALQETPEFSFETELTSTQEETEKIPDSTALPEIPEETTKPEETIEPIVETTEPTKEIEEITEPTEETTESIIEETTEPEIIVSSISGFIWGDGDGSLETDWDGLYNGYEQPLAGYNVYLYLAHDLSTPVDIVQTYEDGSYIFDNLEPGVYTLGLASYTADNDGEYLLPFGITEDCKFAINWDSDPIMAYTELILLDEGQIVQNVNAGMRLPAEPEMRAPEQPALRAEGKTLGQTIEDTKISKKVHIDNSDWYVVRKQTYNKIKYAMLMQAFPQDAPQFSYSGHNNRYEGSQMQSHITDLLKPSNWMYDQYYKTIYSIALVPHMNPDIGSGASGRYREKTTTTEPIVWDPVLAKKAKETKNVLFLPTYADLNYWAPNDWVRGEGWPTANNGAWVFAYPGHPIRDFKLRLWGRTESDDTSYVYGYNNVDNTNAMDGGLYTDRVYYNSHFMVWVWVQTSDVPYTVTVHYVDTDGNSIKPSIKEEKAATSSFTPDVPNIDGYKYIYWKDSLTGEPNTAPVYIDSVIGDMDIYLVYEVDQSKTNVTITKTVTGTFADLNKNFTFTVSFKDGGGTQLMSGAFDYEGTGTVVPQGGQLTIVDGKAVFTLKNGQEIAIKGIPAEYSIQIVETPVSGYEASFTDSAGSSGKFDTDYRIVGKTARTFNFTNTMNAPPPTSINGGDMAIVITIISLVLLIITGSIVFWFAQKRRRIESK
jgi:hypothetical protein